MITIGRATRATGGQPPTRNARAVQRPATRSDFLPRMRSIAPTAAIVARRGRAGYPQRDGCRPSFRSRPGPAARPLAGCSHLAHPAQTGSGRSRARRWLQASVPRPPSACRLLPRPTAGWAGRGRPRGQGRSRRRPGRKGRVPRRRPCPGARREGPRSRLPPPISTKPQASMIQQATAARACVGCAWSR